MCFNYTDESSQRYTTPKSIRSHKGHTVKLSCRSTSPVSWNFTGPSSWNIIKEREPDRDIDKLIIKHVDEYNSGSYTCIGKNEHGLYFKDRASVFVVSGKVMRHIIYVTRFVKTRLNAASKVF